MNFSSSTTEKMNKAKKIVLTLLFTFGLIQLQYKALSQTLELPEVISGDVLSGMKGSTVNRSTRQGATSSLTFGSSTTFGTSSSVNATSGTKSSAESLFKVDGQASSGCNRFVEEIPVISADPSLKSLLDEANVLSL
jgi:hypothetical protein